MRTNHLIPALLSLVSYLPVRAQLPVDLNGTSQTWTSSLGSTSGYPTLAGSTGVAPATVDLGSGVTMTVGYSLVGTAAAFIQSGSQVGNLNVLDGTDSGINASPSQPTVVKNQMTGFTFSISSEGSDGNTTSLDNYARYDFTFNQPVTVSDLTVTDIDALMLWNSTFSANLPVFEDSVLMEAWSSPTVGELGTGTALSATPGSALSTGTIGGIDYVYKPTPVGSAAAATGGLTDSSDLASQATFASTGTPIYGFSLYYFDNLDNSIAYNGGLTIGLQNFTVTPVPEPAGAALLGVAVLSFGIKRRR